VVAKQERIGTGGRKAPDSLSEESDGDLLSEEEQKYLCEKFGVDPSEFDEILGVLPDG
jgi:hypothetical protein